MSRALAILLLATAVTVAEPQPASAQYSCAAVRWFVAMHGRTKALRIARQYGITPSQIRQARACLRG